MFGGATKIDRFGLILLGVLLILAVFAPLNAQHFGQPFMLHRVSRAIAEDQVNVHADMKWIFREDRVDAVARHVQRLADLHGIAKILGANAHRLSDLQASFAAIFGTGRGGHSRRSGRSPLL